MMSGRPIVLIALSTLAAAPEVSGQTTGELKARLDPIVRAPKTTPSPQPSPVGARATGFVSAAPAPPGGATTVPFSPPGRRCPKGG
jgi:hypothetical protein